MAKRLLLDESQLLTVEQASQYLNTHPKNLYRRINPSKIPHYRIPGLGIRFKQDELGEWLESCSVKPEQNVLASSISSSGFSIENFDKILLKGASSVAKKRGRWNYGHGTIFTRKTKKGVIRWYIYFRDENGRWLEKVVRNGQDRRDAVVALNNAVQEVFDAQQGITRQKKISFSLFGEMYLKDYARSNKRSWKTDKYMLKYLNSFFGCSLNEITTHKVEQLKRARLEDGVKPSTVNKYLALVSKMLNAAVEWNFLGENKIKFKKLREENERERILTREEERRLVESCAKSDAEHLKPIVVIALNTGMRKGEILSLKWEQISFASRQIRVEGTKSGKARLIYINDVVSEVLEKLRSKNGQEELFQVKDVKRSFKTACRRAGIEDLRFHDLRHTFASRLVENGVDLITVRDLLGHSSVRITQRYTHSNEEQKKRAVCLLNISGTEFVSWN